MLLEQAASAASSMSLTAAWIFRAVDAPRIHQQWLPEGIFVESSALLLAMGHKLTLPQPESHAAAILIGAPALNAKPEGRNKVYGAMDPRRNTALALGY